MSKVDSTNNFSLTPGEARFLSLAINTAYDSASVTEIFEGDFEKEVMESALNKLELIKGAGNE